ncbi:hypothetical protein [Streptomyces sp. NPDC093149]|uniref:hypothetical protein n=1 Tax=Streptomyces sp. NPDC093149 TaxID=3366031 RepID=UPI00382BAF7E
MRLFRPWYALALPGVYRLTESGVGATARHTARIASQARTEPRSDVCTTATHRPRHTSHRNVPHFRLRQPSVAATFLLEAPP